MQVEAGSNVGNLQQSQSSAVVLQAKISENTYEGVRECMYSLLMELILTVQNRRPKICSTAVSQSSFSLFSISVFCSEHSETTSWLSVVATEDMMTSGYFTVGLEVFKLIALK